MEFVRELDLGFPCIMHTKIFLFTLQRIESNVSPILLHTQHVENISSICMLYS